MPQHPTRPCRRRSTHPSTRHSWTVALLLTALGALALVACGGEEERPLPPVPTPVAADLTAPQIVTEAQRALSSASSVHIKGEYKQDGKPISVDMRLATGAKPTDDRATGVVTTDGVKVELRRIGDTIYLKGDDKFLEALGPQAQATKGKWLKAPVAQADRGLANLTDLNVFASTLAPGEGALTKETVRKLAGQPAISVRSATGARLWVANTNKPYPLRIERIGPATGVLDFMDYDAKVDVKAPTPSQDLASVSS